MKNGEIVMLVAVAAGAFLLLSGKSQGAQLAPFDGENPLGLKAAAMDSVFGSLQATLGNGNVLDTSTGVVYDPLTGNYTNIYTGQIIYAGRQ